MMVSEGMGVGGCGYGGWVHEVAVGTVGVDEVVFIPTCYLYKTHDAGEVHDRWV